MKKLIQILIVFGLVGLLFGCGGDEEKPTAVQSESNPEKKIVTHITESDISDDYPEEVKRSLKRYIATGSCQRPLSQSVLIRRNELFEIVPECPRDIELEKLGLRVPGQAHDEKAMFKAWEELGCKERADGKVGDLGFEQICDFSGADLSNKIFYPDTINGVNFQGANLHAAKFGNGAISSNNFNGADLSEAYLHVGCTFISSFRGADLRGATLDGCVGANRYSELKRSANFEGANLKGVKFARGVTLNYVNFAGRDLSGVTMQGDLDYINLKGANLEGADLSDSTIRYGANLSGANLKGAKITLAVLNGADLTGADLTGANLTGSHLKGTNLTKANLTEAILKDIVDLDEAIKCQTILPWGEDNSGC